MMAQLLWTLALGFSRVSCEALPFSLGYGHGSPSILKECQFQKGISHCVHMVVSVHHGILWNTPKQKYTQSH